MLGPESREAGRLFALLHWVWIKLHISIKAWFSKGKTASACSVNSARDSSALYGEVMTSSSSDGNTEVANLYASGNSSCKSEAHEDAYKTTLHNTRRLIHNSEHSGILVTTQLCPMYQA